MENGTLQFTKMHGLGNDFMVVDNLSGEVLLGADRIKALADRYTGVGFDQLLVIEKPTTAEAEFDYRIYNADGSEVEHCGNGARCFARYVTDKGLTSSARINVNTIGGQLTLILNDNELVTVQMGVPDFNPANIPFKASEESPYYAIEVNNTTIDVGAVAIGNPHVVLQVNDTDTAQVETLGPLLELHERFPKRVNVGFMQLIDRGNIRLRVFERGVGETLACGSGACAAVAIGIRQGLLDKTVNVSLSGGPLKIVWEESNKSIEMTGACSTVFEGQTRM